MKITDEILRKYGHTDGCTGCKYKKAGMENRVHSEMCRKRIEEAMEGDEEGRRMSQAKERENKWLAEQLEKAEEEKREKSMHVLSFCYLEQPVECPKLSTFSWLCCQTVVERPAAARRALAR